MIQLILTDEAHVSCLTHCELAEVSLDVLQQMLSLVAVISRRVQTLLSIRELLVISGESRGDVLLSDEVVTLGL